MSLTRPLDPRRVLFPVVVAATLLCPLGLGFAAAEGQPAREHVVAKSASGYPEERLLRFRFTATNKTDRVLSEAVFRAAAPVRKTSQHALLRIETSADSTLEFDALGNGTLRFDVGPLAPYASAVVTVTAHVAVSAEPRPMRLAAGAWLGAEPFVEIEDPDVIAAARRLAPEPVATEDRPRVARRIYDWVSRTVVDTGFHSRERGAAWALRSKEGDCSEMAFAIVALSRVVGIPARYVGGYVIESSALITPEEFHNWAEWHDGQVWRVSDAQKRIFERGPQRFVATRVFDAERGRDPMRWSADTAGLQVRMQSRR